METSVEKPIGLQIRDVSQSIRRFLDSYIDKYMGWDATGVEGIFLGHIFAFYKKHPGEILTAKLTMELLNIKKAGVSKLLSNLESKGYIKTSKLKNDSRIKEILLTEKGKEAEKKLEDCWNSIKNIVEDGISDQEKKQINHILNKVKDNLAKGEKK